MNNIGGKDIDSPDSLRAERDELRAVLREIAEEWNDSETGQIDGELIERAEKLLEAK